MKTRKILIVGSGEIMTYVARQARAASHRLTLVVADRGEAELLARDLGVTVVAGDGTDPEVLREIEAHLADVVVALTPSDPANLVVCQVARRFFDVANTVALVNDPDNRALFEALGVTQAISVAEIVGTIVRQEADFAGILGQLSLGKGSLVLVEVRLTEDSPSVGRALHELALPEGALIVAILRGGEALIPRGAATLAVDDELVVLSTAPSQREALAILLGDDK